MSSCQHKDLFNKKQNMVYLLTSTINVILNFCKISMKSFTSGPTACFFNRSTVQIINNDIIKDINNDINYDINDTNNYINNYFNYDIDDDIFPITARVYLYYYIIVFYQFDKILQTVLNRNFIFIVSYTLIFNCRNLLALLFALHLRNSFKNNNNINEDINSNINYDIFAINNYTNNDNNYNINYDISKTNNNTNNDINNDIKRYR